MKDGNEIIAVRQMLRALSGVLAAMGLLVAGIGIVKHALSGDWFEVPFRLGPLFGTWLFGYFAITGRPPLPVRPFDRRDDDRIAWKPRRAPAAPR